MAIDPAVIETTPEGRAADRIASLERRVRALETQATIQTGSGAPTGSARDGTPYADASGVRLYLRIGGTWRYTALT